MTMVTDATAGLTAPRSILANVFERGQYLINSRYFDVVLPQIEQVVFTDYVAGNARLNNALQGIANAMTVRINFGTSNTKPTSIAAVNDAVSKFTPASTARDVTVMLATLKADAD